MNDTGDNSADGIDFQNADEIISGGDDELLS
jgi:hypothetical protein